MFSVESVRRIIRTSLEPLGLYSTESEEMLIMIAAHESKMGAHLRQIGGPACGLYGVEPDTMHDNYENYLDYREDLSKKISEISGVSTPSVDHLTYNPIYSTIHARLKLYRSPGALPSDVQSMAEYCKEYYNSPDGKATVEKYITDYEICLNSTK